MTERERDDSGRYTTDTQYTKQDFLDAIAVIENPTTSDIADHVGSSRSTARHWLQELESNEEVTSTKIGNAVVWTKPR